MSSILTISQPLSSDALPSPFFLSSPSPAVVAATAVFLLVTSGKETSRGSVTQDQETSFHPPASLIPSRPSLVVLPLCLPCLPLRIRTSLIDSFHTTFFYYCHRSTSVISAAHLTHLFVRLHTHSFTVLRLSPTYYLLALFYALGRLNRQYCSSTSLSLTSVLLFLYNSLIGTIRYFIILQQFTKHFHSNFDTVFGVINRIFFSLAFLPTSTVLCHCSNLGTPCSFPLHLPVRRSSTHSSWIHDIEGHLQTQSPSRTGRTPDAKSDRVCSIACKWPPTDLSASCHPISKHNNRVNNNNLTDPNEHRVFLCF